MAAGARHVFFYFSIFLFLFLASSYLKFNFYDEHKDVKIEQEQSFSTGNLKWRHTTSPRVVSEFSQAVDEEWIPIMKHSEITHCIPFDAFDAYADKFIIELAGGYKAMIKLMEKQSLFDRALRTIFYDPEINRGTKRNEAGEYQAMPELAAWHVDRVLKFYRKPPITSRFVSHKLLYPSFLTSLLPDYRVAVTIHAWVDRLEKYDPSTSVMQYIVDEPLEHSTTENVKEFILQISDILIFDFLVDDHDRQAEKNWVMRNGLYLSWDNGLGWHHGPFGATSCLDILCGSNKWRAYSGVSATNNKQCKRTCVFRKSTVDLLHAIGPDSLEHERLGSLLREELRTKDPEMFPLFHYGVYFSDETYSEMVRYDAESFFIGLNQKAQILLEHIDACIAKHGSDVVIQSL